MQKVHNEVHQQVSASNDPYKQQADKHRRFVEFAEGDMVMVRIHPECIPPRAFKILHPRNTGPYKILKKDWLQRLCARSTIRFRRQFYFQRRGSYTLPWS